MLRFVRPDYCYRSEYTEMMDEWLAEGSRIAPWPLLENYHSDGEFEAALRRVNGAAFGAGVGEYAPSQTWWVRDAQAGRLVGAVNIRFYLTKEGFAFWGHIGFGVRPSERRKSYAAQMLQMALERCRAMDMERVLLGCEEENLASARTIEKCGGQLENIVACGDGGAARVKRYWIDL